MESNFCMPGSQLGVYVRRFFLFSLKISSTMARLKKESEKRARALRKEREARALERRNARRAEKAEDEGGGGVSNVARLREEGERQDKNKGQEAVDSEEEDGDEEGEKEEEEFDPEEGLLLVYVCTHVAVISKGKGVAGTYLVATDTSWKSREQLATSAILLETFAAAIDRIQVQWEWWNTASCSMLGCCVRLCNISQRRVCIAEYCYG